MFLYRRELVISLWYQVVMKLQLYYKCESSFYFLCRVSLVGRKSFTVFHRKCLILVGTLVCQMRFHRSVGFDWEVGVLGLVLIWESTKAPCSPISQNIVHCYYEATLALIMSSRPRDMGFEGVNSRFRG